MAASCPCFRSRRVDKVARTPNATPSCSTRSRACARAIRTSFSLLAYYKFSLFWDIDNAHTGSIGNWFQSPRNATSPLPTRGLLQVHEVFSDSRYLSGAFRFGLQLQMSLGRSNIQSFAQTGETAATSYTSEAAVPYVIYVMNRGYRARLYVPVYTVVSHEDENLTYTTFSLSPKGRGRAFSVGLSNQFYVPTADLLVNWDLSYLDYKFRSVTNDRTRIGTSVAATYAPAYARGGFVTPKVGYFTDRYYLPTVIVEDFSLRPNSPKSVAQPLQVKRVDQGLNYGLTAGIDFFGQHRLQGEASFTYVKSNLPDWPLNGTLFLMRYLWTFPSTGEVGRFLRYTERNPLNGTFEGDGGL